MDQTIQFYGEHCAAFNCDPVHSLVAILGARGERVEPNSQENRQAILLLVGGIAGLYLGRMPW